MILLLTACRGFAALALAGILLATAPSARALERVTLRNGFSYDCTRREPLDTLHTRLYLVGTEQGSFIDLRTAEIDSVDDLPPSALPPPAALPPGTENATPDLGVYLHRAGLSHNIDAELLASVVAAESGGRVRAVSRTGAQGLMQLMPATARAQGVRDAFTPEDNINGGTGYLDLLLTRYHDNLALALAAYNAGPAAVDRFHGIPPYRETRAYVVRVMNEFKRRKLLLQHATVAASGVTR